MEKPVADDKSYLPDPKLVIQSITFHDAAVAAAAATPAGAQPTFRILRTNVLDPYEKKQTHANIAASAAAPATGIDDFAGKDRKKAKLSIGTGALEKFDDLSGLLDSLVTDAEMAAHKPKISTLPTSDRVDEEERNVSVTAWLYAASRAAANDFPIISLRDPR